jgi:putative phosphoribosyl transferase
MRGGAFLRDRTHAGGLLAPVVADALGGETGCVVLGIVRGGVVVALPVARALGVALDVAVPRKLGAPGQPELAIGAVADGVQVLDEELIERLGVGEERLARAVADAEAEIRRRTVAYRGDAPPPALAEATAVIVDDGIATGSTALAAAAWARLGGATRVMIAAPVASSATVRRLADAGETVIVLATPEPFHAVGQWYDRFEQVDDEEVRAALAAAR